MPTRRDLLAAAGGTAFGLTFWRQALAQAATPRIVAGPYGPLRDPDRNGVRLPAGFRSRVLARSGELVPGTGYRFPAAPDGAATFPMPVGGWMLCVNAELDDGAGGVSALRFARDGRIVGAGAVLEGTSRNCSGGPTPWGTWLSCEEHPRGRVHECDPTGRTGPRTRAALGVFQHEAACVDPAGRAVYLTEDEPDGCLYRFRSADYPRLDRGRLEVAVRARDGRVAWRPVPDPAARRRPTREQVRGALRFARAEGIWFDDGVVYLATTADDTIHALETRTRRLRRLFRGADAEGRPLRGLDNLTVSRGGDLFVCEDPGRPAAGGLDIGMLPREGGVARFCTVTGSSHRGSELTGVTFDPSGRRMTFASQRGGAGGGVLFEVSGPFRRERPPGARPGGRRRPRGTRPAVTGGAGVALGIEAARRISVGATLGRGVPVRLTLGLPRDVTATLHARMVVRGRRRTVLLARTRSRGLAGSRTLRLRPRGRADRRRLRARRHGLRAEVRVRIGATTVRRPVVLTPG